MTEQEEYRAAQSRPRHRGPVLRAVMAALGRLHDRVYCTAMGHSFQPLYTRYDSVTLLCGCGKRKVVR